MSSTPDSDQNPPSPSGENTPSSGVPIQPQPKPRLLKFDNFIKKHRRLDRAFKAYLEPYYRHIAFLAQGPTPEADKARFERIFRPWPKWVIRLIAEVWHVDFPTIPVEVFFDTLRVLNACFFRCPTNPEESVATRKMNALDRMDPKIFPVVMAAFFGHAFEHLAAQRKELDALRKEGKISEAEYAEKIKSASSEQLEQTLRDCFGSWSEDKDTNPLDITQAIENARRKTFDRHGRRKDKPQTPIYRVMLSNWITIENMTGPKELTNFLTPHLKGKSKSATGEQARIATLCSRLGVKFRGKSRTIDLRR